VGEAFFYANNSNLFVGKSDYMFSEFFNNMEEVSVNYESIVFAQCHNPTFEFDLLKE